MTRTFAINGLLYVNFGEVQNLRLYFRVMLKSVFELSYFKSKRPVKKHFFQNFKGPLFLTGWLYEYHFWRVLRHLSGLCKKYSFATLVNKRQKL